MTTWLAAQLIPSSIEPSHPTLVHGYDEALFLLVKLVKGWIKEGRAIHCKRDHGREKLRAIYKLSSSTIVLVMS